MEIFDERKYTYSDPYSSGRQFPLAVQRSLHPPCLPQNPHVDSQGPRGIFGLDLEWKNIVLEVLVFLNHYSDMSQISPE